jgi:hypothetical protein
VTTHTARRLATIITAALMLALAVGTTSARELAVSEQSIRTSWASLEFGSSLATVRCRVTFEGSFHSRTLQKVVSRLIGAVTAAIVAHPCTNGEAWADNGREAEPLGTAPQKLPFHLTYQSFTGTLPNISSISIGLSRVSFVVQATSFGISARCRYGRTEDSILAMVQRTIGGIANGALAAITPISGMNEARLVDGLLNGGLCPASGRFTGSSGAITGLSNPATISVTLI